MTDQATITEEATQQEPNLFTAPESQNMNLPVQAPKKTPALVAGGFAKAIVPQNIEEAFRLAKVIAMAKWAPKSYQIDPKNVNAGFDENKILLGIMHGLEVGLTPIAALQSIAVINGTPSIWGDGALAIVQASGMLEDFKELPLFDEKQRITGYQCAAKRKGVPTPFISQFTLEDAAKAELIGKSGPWQQYRTRMLQMRARAWTLRAGFADVLRGLSIAEEAQDTPVEAVPVNKVSPLKRAPSARSALDTFATDAPPATPDAQAEGTTAGDTTDGNQASAQG
jgi:hypothetical protein